MNEEDMALTKIINNHTKFFFFCFIEILFHKLKLLTNQIVVAAGELQMEQIANRKENII